MRALLTSCLLALAILVGSGPPARAGAVEAGVRPWPGATIPVWVHPDVKRTPRYAMLKRAMAEWNRTTGVRFFETPTPGPNTLYVDNRPRGARCDALVGLQRSFLREGRPVSGGRITLGACSYGSVLHELGHVLGLAHEQLRPDRARYIDFSPVAAVLRNCMRSALGCLEAPGTIGTTRRLQLASDYDPCSLMHYLADQSSKVRQGRLPPSPGWSRFYRLTASGEANFRACRARLRPVDGCWWDKTGQKCQATCQDANTVAVFHGLRPRRACWGRGPTRR